MVYGMKKFQAGALLPPETIYFNPFKIIKLIVFKPALAFFHPKWKEQLVQYRRIHTKLNNHEQF
jgi:hypothetical protein